MSAPAPTASCPKCGLLLLEGGETCRRCGLRIAGWSSAQSEPTLLLDLRGAQLWAELQQRWKEEALHDAFVKHCSSTGRLPAAGRMYRACLDRDPGNQLAARMQTRIVGVAMALFTSSQPPGPAVSRKSWFWWVLVAGAVGGLLASLVLGAMRS
jgi:hypothetical protein